jgi:hypothetical protein
VVVPLTLGGGELCGGRGGEGGGGHFVEIRGGVRRLRSEFVGRVCRKGL